MSQEYTTVDVIYQESCDSKFCKWVEVIKFHEMLHECRDIRLLGPHDGFDGRPGESAHKFTKLNARKTQRRNNLFEFQTWNVSTNQRYFKRFIVVE